jgi:hypothetical protein
MNSINFFVEEAKWLVDWFLLLNRCVLKSIFVKFCVMLLSKLFIKLFSCSI